MAQSSRGTQEALFGFGEGGSRKYQRQMKEEEEEEEKDGYRITEYR